MSKTIDVSKIRTDGGTQPRSQLDAFVVSDYAEAMDRGDSFPPVDVMYDGTDYWLWDGFHRLKAARKAGRNTVEAKITQGTKEDAVWQSLSANKSHGLRRTRADKKRAVIRALEGWGKSKSAREIARHVGVSHPTVLKYNEEVVKLTTSSQKDHKRGRGGRVKGKDGVWHPVKKKAKSDLPQKVVEVVKDTHVADDLTEQRELAKLPAQDQLQVADLVRSEGMSVKDARREIRRAETDQRAREIEQQASAVPEGKYQCIVIDPPWPMKKIERDDYPDQVNFDYPTMKEDDLRAFPLPEMAADDCHLYLWTTHKFMPMALRLAEHWGFRYQCMMTWVKNVGFTPFSWMYSTEHVLFCRRGSLKLKKMGMRLDFEAPRREHSRKPDVFYDLVRKASPRPRIDVFSREERDGFAQFGNETDKFDE